MSRLTERQERDWPHAIARLRNHYVAIPEDIASWSVSYAEEVRPGRGHHINATFTDGEVFCQVLMDVYGQPSVSIAELEWMHADADEECECWFCVAEREDDQ